MSMSKQAKIRPFFRLLGALVLGLFALGAYFAARLGELELVIVLLAMFLLMAPPILIGKLPGNSFGLSGGFEDELNKNPFKLEEGEDRGGFVVALVVAFVVTAGLAIVSFL